MSDPIKKGTRPDGSTFYWFRISAGRHPVTRKRMQVYRSKDTRKEALAEYARITHEISERRFVAPDGTTVSGFLDWWSRRTAVTWRRGQGRS